MYILKLLSELLFMQKGIGKVFFDDELYGKVESFVKKSRPHSLNAEECMDILVLKAHMRHKHEKQKKKNGSGRPMKAPQISKRVAKALHSDEQLVKKVWSDFICIESIDSNV